MEKLTSASLKAHASSQVDRTLICSYTLCSKQMHYARKVFSSFFWLLELPIALGLTHFIASPPLIFTMKIAAALAFCLASASAFAPAQKSASSTALFGSRLPPKVNDNQGLEHIFEANKQWQGKMIEGDAKFFDKLG